MLMSVGYSTRRLVAGRDHVGGVHDAGVGFAERHLLDDGLHVLLELSRLDLDAGVGEHLGVRPKGTWGARHHDEVGVGEVGDPVDAQGLPDSTMISERVGGEHAGLSGGVGVGQLVMFFRSAEANTSAGAPSVIWLTRSDDDPKLNSTRVGVSRLKASPIAVNDSVSDAAAKTVIDVWSVADESDPHAAAASARGPMKRNLPTTRIARE